MADKHLDESGAAGGARVAPDAAESSFRAKVRALRAIRRGAPIDRPHPHAEAAWSAPAAVTPATTYRPWAF